MALFLVDAREGVTPLDRHFAHWLRRVKKPVVLVANKAEGRGTESGIAEAYGLGLGEPVPFRPSMARAWPSFTRRFCPMPESRRKSRAEPAPPADDRPSPCSSPSSGGPMSANRPWSTASLARSGCLTGPEPGITRDAIAVDWSWRGRRLRLVDTAGLRRKARIEVKTRKTFRRRHAPRHPLRRGRGAGDRRDPGAGAPGSGDRASGRRRRAARLVLAVNKWDLVEKRKETLEKITERLAESLPQLAGLKPLTLSAADRRRARQADAGGHRGRRRLEPARADAARSTASWPMRRTATRRRWWRAAA